MDDHVVVFALKENISFVVNKLVFLCACKDANCILKVNKA